MCGCVFVGVVYAKVQFAMSQPKDETCLKEKSTLKHIKSRSSCDRDSTVVLIYWLTMYCCYFNDKFAVACHADVTGGQYSHSYNGA